MGKNHVKSLSAPKTWDFKRKETTFVPRPNPGAHTLDHTVSLSFFMKHIVKKAVTRKEVKYILHQGEVFVDGKKRHDEKSQVGLMDVVSFPKLKEHYRLLLNDKNKLCAVKIDDAEAKMKLVKVVSKTVLGAKKVQVNCTGGRNFLLEKNAHVAGETVVLSLPDQKATSTVPFEVGVKVLLTSGKKAGTVATLKKIEGENIHVEADKEFETKKVYAFVLGKDKPLIKVA